MSSSELRPSFVPSVLEGNASSSSAPYYGGEEHPHRTSTPTGIMNGSSLRHPTANAPTRTIDSRNTLNSPTSVANVIQMNNISNPLPLETSTGTSSVSHEQLSLPSHMNEGNNSMMEIRIRHPHSLLTSSPPHHHHVSSPYEIRSYDSALLNNMSLAEISTIQNMLTNQLMDLETNIHQVRSQLGGSVVNTRASTPPPAATAAHRTEDQISTSSGSMQERRPSFGARAA